MNAIIVTADDFACSPQVTAGICEARRCGVVTETSILIRSPWAAESIGQGQDVGLSIGLHLDLVTPFVTDRSQDFGPERRFHCELAEREFQGRVGRPFSCGELICIRDEMRSQIEDFVGLAGCLPSHLDYHYGLHYLPDVMALYLTVAEDYGLPVRWGPQYAGANPYPLAPSCLDDRFRGREEGGMDLFLQLVDEPCHGVKEILCHPGYTTPGVLADAYNHERELELKVLTDPKLGDELAKRQVQLVDYAWLKEHLTSTGAVSLSGSKGGSRNVRT
jgi:predicted glycoside hydrolase/deacetylase ChbG (UPF0249 family)